MEETFGKYGKTLRELLSCIMFDDIVPLILSEERSHCVLSKYKEAYDILLHLEPAAGKCPDIQVSRLEGNDGKLLSACYVEGNFWEDVIDGDIYLEEGPDVPDALIAYTLLWHLTFYGYNEKSKKESCSRIMFGDRPDNKYGRLAFEAEVKRDFDLADRDTKRAIVKSVLENEAEGGMMYGLTEEQWDSIAYHRVHCNGPKRKRDARLQRRIERLDRMAICENSIQRILENQLRTNITRSDLCFLAHADKRSGCEFQSQSFDASSRLQYIIDLISKYDAAYMEDAVGKIALRIASSTKYPVTEVETATITGLIQDTIHPESINLCLGEDNSLDQELSVLIIGEAVQK